MGIRRRYLLQFRGAFVVVALAGMGCSHPTIAAASPPGAVSSGAAATTKAPFGSSNALIAGHSVTYPDGLTIELDKIDDSRCPPAVSCVWAGELAPQLTLHGGEVGAPRTVALGTVTRRMLVVAGYGFALIEANSTSATIVVTNPGQARGNNP